MSSEEIQIRYSVQRRSDSGRWSDLDTYYADTKGTRHESVTAKVADAERFRQLYNRSLVRHGIPAAELRIVRRITTTVTTVMED